MKLVLALVAGALALASARNPVLPQQWVAEQINTLAINQGGEPGADGATCCPAEAPECKVQTEFQAGKQYFDLANNRTAFKTASGAGVVSLFNDGKEYEVDSNGNCQSYCPLGTHIMVPFALLAPNSTNEGTTTFDGVSCTDFRNVQTIILNITMSQTDTYVVLNGANGPDTPVAQVQLMEPFGMPMGKQSILWKSFQAGASTVPDSAFVVNGAAKCPINSQCEGDGDGGSSSSGGQVELAAFEGFHARSLSEKAKILNSMRVPIGYSSPSHLWPTPSFN